MIPFPISRARYGGGDDVRTDTADLSIVGYGVGHSTFAVTNSLGGALSGSERAKWALDIDYAVPSWISQVPASERKVTRVTFWPRGDNNGDSQVCTGAVVGVVTDNGGGSYTVDPTRISTIVGGPTPGSPLVTGIWTELDALLTTPLTVAAGEFLAVGLLTSGESGILYVQGSANATIGHAILKNADDLSGGTLTGWADGDGFGVLAMFWVTTTAKTITMTVGASQDIEYDTLTTIPVWKGIGHYAVLDTVATATNDVITTAFSGVQTSTAGAGNGKLVESSKLVLDVTANETVAYPWSSATGDLNAYTNGDDFMMGIHTASDQKTSRAFLMNIVTGDGGGSLVKDRTIQSVNNVVADDGTRGNETTGYRDFADSGLINEERYLTHVEIAQTGGTPTVANLVICRKPWFFGHSSWGCAGNTYGLEGIGTELDDSSLGYFTAQPFIWALNFSGGYVRERTAEAGGIFDKSGLAFAGVLGVTTSSTAGTHDTIDLKDCVIGIEAPGINDFGQNGSGPGSDYATVEVPRLLGALEGFMSAAQQNGNTVIVTEAVSHLSAVGAAIANLDDAVALFNTSLPFSCEAHGAICVRAFNVLCDYDFTASSYRIRTDLKDAGSYNHLNQTGNRLEAKQIADSYEGRI
jgi:hypothetical protein